MNVTNISRIKTEKRTFRLSACFHFSFVRELIRFGEMICIGFDYSN